MIEGGFKNGYMYVYSNSNYLGSEISYHPFNNQSFYNESGISLNEIIEEMNNFNLSQLIDLTKLAFKDFKLYDTKKDDDTYKITLNYNKDNLLHFY